MSRLGVDIGGVIIESISKSADTSFFSDNYLNTPALPDAIEVLAELANTSFKDNIWLISKCGETVQAKTEAWLLYHEFYRKTGIKPERVKFTRTREEKADVAKKLQLTHFIDDRLEVLSYMADTIPILYLYNPSQEEVDEHKDALEHITLMQSWDAIKEALQ